MTYNFVDLNVQEKPVHHLKDKLNHKIKHFVSARDAEEKVSVNLNCPSASQL